MKEGDLKKSILDYTYKEFNELNLPYDEMEKLLHQDSDEYEEWRQRHKSEIWEDGKEIPGHPNYKHRKWEKLGSIFGVVFTVVFIVCANRCS